MTDDNSEIPRFEIEVTGSKGEPALIRYYVFGKYLIAVKLSRSGKFLGITEVRLDKDFRSLEQKLQKATVFNIGEYVPE